MIRTQIYLSASQRACLALIASQKGENVSELVRTAIEKYIDDQKKNTKKRQDAQERIFRKAFGMWRDNPIDFAALRKNADRF